MLNAHKALVFLLLSVSLIFVAAEDPVIRPFYFGDEMQISLAAGEIVYFKFDVPEVDPNYDLSIIAEPSGDCDPELFVSTVHTYPKSKETSEYYSTSYGYSSIYIPSAQVKAKTDYYLGVLCASEQCDFTVTVDYAQEYYMRPQINKLMIEYMREGTLVARVYIPKSNKASHILIAAELENIDEVDEGLHMYANAGNTIPTSQTHDIAATAAWKDGKAIYIYSGDKHFCTGCNYTVVMQAPKKAKVILTRTVYGDVLNTPLNFERNDAVERNHSVHYMVNTTRLNVNTTFILVEVKPYIGFFRVYANFGTLPDDLEKYHYSMQGHSQEMLTIPIPEKFSHEPLYITVNAFSHTTYTLKVYEQGKRSLLLNVGEPETSYVPSHTVENFLAVIDGRKDMKLTFSLHPEKGHVDLFVKTCAEKAKCSFTKTEVDHILSGATPTSKKSPILQFSNVTDGDEVINIQMDGSVCNPASGSNVPKCYFAVGVLGTSKTASKFTLTVSKAGLHQPLRIGRSAREHLTLDQYKYYYFTVSNDTGIESVNFQVTKISGDVGIFISRASKYPDLKNREKTHHYNDLYSFERRNFTDLKGTYYIAVKAYTSATYSILPLVKYDVAGDSIGSHHLVRINEGIPQKSVLDNNETMYFKFESNFAEGESNGIEIALNEVQGNFEICVRTDEQLPTPLFCQFKSQDNLLVIPSFADGYQDSGTYIVAVFPRASNHTASGKARALSFSITWSAFHNFRTLSFSVPFANWVSHTRTIYYKFEVHPVEDKEIILHKTTTASSNAKVDMYLANADTKFGHNTTTFLPDRTSNGSDTIRLKEADIVSLCSPSGVLTESKKCYLYVAVKTTSEEDVQFVLSLTKDFDDLRLSESVQTFYSFPSKEHPLHLYYYPHHLEDVTFLAHTWGRNIALYANVINTREHSSRREWNYPTDKSHEYVSKESSSHKGESRLHINAEDLSSCGADYDKFRCGVALTLYYTVPHNEGSNDLANSHYKEFSMFSIIANQEITPIRAGRPIHTSVNEGAYKYFDLYVGKEEATLLISATVLSGKHTIILATKGKDARPTVDNCEFQSAYGKVETLQISGSETLGESAKGDWVIAIYGFSHTEFILNVVYEKNKIIELHRGLPTTIDVSKDPVFFEYYHEVDSSFQLKLTRERGAGIVSLRKYSGGAPVAGNLPNETNGEIIRHFDHVQTMITVSNTTDYFERDCLYIVGVFAHKSMKISIVAQLPGQFIFLQDNMIFTDYASKSIHNKYEHVTWANRVIDINMVVYSGEPHIYVAHNPTVNETHHLWAFDHATPNNFIRLKLNNTKFNGQHLEPVFDGHSFVPSISNIYYIVVTAPVPSNYSIAVSVSNSTRYLIDGHMDFGFLNSGEFNLYKYHVSQDAQTSSTYKLKLQFAMYRDEFSIARHEKFHAPHISVMTVPQKQNQKGLSVINQETLMPELPVLEPVRSDVLERNHADHSFILNLQYLAPSDHDFYIVVNNTKSKNHLNYSITANTHEPLYLTMNNMHASRVPVGESDIYAVHASHAGILVIEIHECMGKVIVESSHSRHFVSTVPGGKTASLINHKPAVDDESFSSVEPDVIPNLNTLIQSSLGPHISLASIEIQEEQTVYIIITAIDGEVDSDVLPDKDAVYKIRTNLHPLKNFMPFTNLAPGNDGQINWDITSGGKLKIGFEEVHNLAYMTDRVKSSTFGDLDIQYKYDVFFTKDAKASTYLSRCDMLPNSEGTFKGMDRYQNRLYYDQSNITSDPEKPEHKFLEVDLEDDATDIYATLKVTAIGVDSTGKPVWDYPIIYQTAEVKNITPSGVYSFLTFLLGLCMIMLVIALIGLYYYYEKFKRVKARLNYEMQDLRNIASTVESFDVLDDIGDKKQKGGYHGLIEEENV